MQTLHIKSMVCNRCIQVVRQEAARAGLEVADVRLGEVEIPDSQPEAALDAFYKGLEAVGFELVRDRRARVVEQVKLIVLECIHHQRTKPENLNFSDYLAQELNLDYGYLSRVFSEQENVTLEKYIIYQKIERAKELLIYEEMTLAEIAFSLGYSSPQHLSNQFRAVTGLTPSAFRQSNERRRKPLDHVV